MNCEGFLVEKGHFPCRSLKRRRSPERENHGSLCRHLRKALTSPQSNTPSKRATEASVVTFEILPQVHDPILPASAPQEPPSSSSEGSHMPMIQGFK